jgi:alpha-glucosidase
LPLAGNAAHENVANLAADARSILSLYKALIRLRKQRPQLVAGSYVPVVAEGDLLLYRREADGDTIMVALNLGAEPVSLSSDAIGLEGQILLSTHMDRNAERVDGSLDLRGNEGVVIGERTQAG